MRICDGILISSELLTTEIPSLQQFLHISTGGDSLHEGRCQCASVSAHCTQHTGQTRYAIPHVWCWWLCVIGVISKIRASSPARDSPTEWRRGSCRPWKWFIPTNATSEKALPTRIAPLTNCHVRPVQFHRTAKILERYKQNAKSSSRNKRRYIFSDYCHKLQPEVLGRTNHLVSFHTPWAAQKTTRPTILLLLRAYSLLR
jgi:hypothetical protein